MALGLEHTAAGKVEIGVSVVNVGPRDADNLQQYSLKFEILDTGCGMGQAMMHQLLEPSQLKHRRALGLRVLLASKVAQLLGGSLEVSSTLHKGTIWTLSIKCPGTWCLSDLHVSLAMLDGAGEA